MDAGLKLPQTNDLMLLKGLKLLRLRELLEEVWKVKESSFVMVRVLWCPQSRKKRIILIFGHSRIRTKIQIHVIL